MATDCVLCRQRPIDPRWRPFCSERCRLLDLARWADGSYRVEAETPLETEEDDEGDPRSGGSQA